MPVVHDWTIVNRTTLRPSLVTSCGCRNPTCWWVLDVDMTSLRRYAEDWDT